MSQARARYDTVAIILHWMIAAAILSLIPVGLWMSDALEHHTASQMTIFTIVQMHKSAGLTVLVLSLARLGWRLAHRAPDLPDAMPVWEKRAARATHVLFYALMIGLPLTGWAAVSASPWGIPTLWFGLFEWPHLPGLPDLAYKKPVAEAFEAAHGLLAYLAILLIALHVGAALRHHLLKGDDVLARMIPVLSPRPKA